MTGEHLEAILKTVQAKGDKEGWQILPDGQTMTLHLAHDGASLSVSRVEALRTDGEILYARTPKRDLYAIAKSDLYAVAVEGAAAIGAATRRAGFG